MQKNTKKSERIELLKDRTKHCCCRYCGSELEIQKIIFSEHEEARIEIFCPECDRIEYGTEKEIFNIAKYFVEELNFNCFGDINENGQIKRMTIAKVCDIMAWENKTLGFLDETGFKVPLKYDPKVVGETLTLSEDDLLKISRPES